MFWSNGLLGNIPLRIVRRLGWAESFNLSGRVDISGASFKIPILKGVGYYNLVGADRHIFKLIRDLLRTRQGTFIDVGANIGQTLLKIRAISREIPYIGFEPNPTCIYYLSQLIRENRFRNIQLVPVALARQSGLAELMSYDDSGADSSATILEGLRPKQKVQQRDFVAKLDLGSVMGCLKMDDISVVKVDVEGAESEVLETFEPLLLEKRPPFLIEVLPVYDITHASRLERQKRIERLVERSRYVIFRILKSEGGSYTLDRIEEIGIHSDISMCDYLLLPEESIGQYSFHLEERGKT
jgi:FkbM family methyltransferase